MRMITIVPDERLRGELTAALGRVPDLQLVRFLVAYPELDELLQSIRIHTPDFLLVEVADDPQVAALLGGLDDLMPGLPVVAVAHKIDTELARKLMHLAVRETIEAPISADKLSDVADRIERRLKKHPGPAAHLAPLYAFFPAKPGVGTSTVALSISCALADELGTRTLLLDCDLAAGLINYHLKLGDSASILDALNHAADLDEDLWRQMVGKHDHLDVLHAGGLNAPAPADPSGLHQLLALARAQYEVIIADLGSSLDSFSVEVLRESRRIFLVTTPELAPVHLAQARVQSFRGLGIEDRVSLVLNRRDRWPGHFTSAVVADAVGLPLAFCIGNDYKTCSDALMEGDPLPSASEIGRSILNLAHSLTADTPGQPIPATHGRKFLEFFHISRADQPAASWRA
jgi:pilus assembly protein CpaE